MLFVLTDDQRWDAISLAGIGGPLETPNVDRLGREGVFFRNAFATTSLCSPSRATILNKGTIRGRQNGNPGYHPPVEGTSC